MKYFLNRARFHGILLAILFSEEVGISLLQPLTGRLACMIAILAHSQLLCAQDCDPRGEQTLQTVVPAGLHDSKKAGTSTEQASDNKKQETYYLVLFGFQDTINRVEHSHTFATFVKSSPDSQGKDSLDVQTISWLPKTFAGSVPIWFSRPETGTNYSLEETLGFTVRYQFKIAMWGPYEISKDLFERALEKIRILKTGQILYHAPDSAKSHARAYNANPNGAENCMHAVSDVVRFHRTGLDWGIPASRHIFEEDYKPLLVRPDKTEDWLIPKLQLDRYPIRRMK